MRYGPVTGTIKADIEARFMKFVLKREDDVCWFWWGAHMSNGYGTFKLWGNPKPAHRRAYWLFKGPIPKGMYVLHSCDTKDCVNPAHLHLGTHADNMRELRERGPASRRYGE